MSGQIEQPGWGRRGLAHVACLRDSISNYGKRGHLHLGRCERVWPMRPCGDWCLVCVAFPALLELAHRASSR